MPHRLMCLLCAAALLLTPGAAVAGAGQAAQSAAHLAAAQAETGTSLARLVPAGTPLYIEITRPDLLFDQVLSPQFIALIEQSPGYRERAETPQVRQFQQAIAALEERLGMDWQPALRALTGEGVALAFHPEGRRALIAVASRDADLLGRLREALHDLIRGAGGNVASHEHAGTDVFALGENGSYAVADGLLLVSNNADLLHGALDLREAGGAGSLVETDLFREARALVPEGEAAWAMIDMEFARQIPQLQAALAERAENIVAPLLLGGVLPELRHARVLAASAHAEGDDLRLRLAVPRSAPESEAVAGVWAPEGEGEAAAPLRPPGTIATMSFYRDLSAIWNARSDLLTEAGTAQLSQLDTGFSLFFSGRSFGAEVLPEVGPRIRLVVARQNFDDGRPVPANRLPAFAEVLELRNPEEFGQNLVVAYQTVVGIVNITAGQQGNPQLLIESEEYNGVRITRAGYLATDNPAAEGEAPLIYNFTPSCAVVGDYFVLSSTYELCRDLVDELQSADSAPIADNLVLEIEAGPLREVLDDNRAQLVSRNMISEGYSQEEAEHAIGQLFEALELLEGARLRLARDAQAVTLDLTIEMNLSAE